MGEAAFSQFVDKYQTWRTYASFKYLQANEYSEDDMRIDIRFNLVLEKALVRLGWLFSLQTGSGVSSETALSFVNHIISSLADDFTGMRDSATEELANLVAQHIPEYASYLNTTTLTSAL